MMRGFLILVLLIVVGYYLYMHFRGPSETETPPPPPPDTGLPVETTMGPGEDMSIVVGGKVTRFGVSMISPASEPGATDVVVAWVQSGGLGRRSLQLSTDDEAPAVAGPLAFRLDGIEEAAAEAGGAWRAAIRVTRGGAVEAPADTSAAGGD